MSLSEWVEKRSKKRVGIFLKERKWGKGEKQADSRIKVSVWLRREIVQVVSHLQRKRKEHSQPPEKKNFHKSSYYTRQSSSRMWVKKKKNTLGKPATCRYSSLLTWLASQFPFPHYIIHLFLSQVGVFWMHCVLCYNIIFNVNHRRKKTNLGPNTSDSLNTKGC